MWDTHKKIKMSDSKKRSVAKAITWRVIGILLLIVIAVSMSVDLEKALYVTAIFHSIRTVLFYYHERAWNSVKWGEEK
ncbi:unnamed protein product [marine sediment metagenome]|uniref:DUF2061 domain-containing protein n=1 Tax=marine sediment metagenome TaxID=412755 RepID=X1F6B4_9ZZZZ